MDHLKLQAMEKAAINKEHNNFSDCVSTLLTLKQLRILMQSYERLGLSYF